MHRGKSAVSSQTASKYFQRLLFSGRRWQQTNRFAYQPHGQMPRTFLSRIYFYLRCRAIYNSCEIGCNNPPIFTRNIRWIGADKSAKKSSVPTPGPELKITQEMRQIAYDNKTTTDDHGMHIFGLAKDQEGRNYFMVKNSWGEAGKYKGIWYASDSFVKYKTLNFLVHKDAVPEAIKAKLRAKQQETLFQF